MITMMLGNRDCNNHRRHRIDGVWPYRQANPNLGWETVTMTNIGVDASFFQNAFSVQVDAYNKVTSDILLEVPMPLELGLAEGNSDDYYFTKCR